jgi:RNA polymerase sigma-70 factor (ECF subfamily)
MGATAQLDDEQLYEAWIQGEERAGRELISRRFMGVRRVIASLLPASEVDDAVQDVFVRLTARAKQGQPIQAIKQFTAGVARNVVHERLRAKTRQPLDLSAHSIADILPLQSARMVMQEEQRLLLKGLHRLPVDDQILLGLRYWEQLRTRELAVILGSNHNTVRAQLRRAQLRLVQIVAGLADSPEAAQSTFGSFDGWAKDMRGRVDEPT